jgi:hypothetical protein
MAGMIPHRSIGETKMNQIDNNKADELKLDELDAASGGFLWIGVVVGAFALGTAIRMGIDKVVAKITH